MRGLTQSTVSIRALTLKLCKTLTQFATSISSTIRLNNSMGQRGIQRGSMRKYMLKGRSPPGEGLSGCRTEANQGEMLQIVRFSAHWWIRVELVMAKLLSQTSELTSSGPKTLFRVQFWTTLKNLWMDQKSSTILRKERRVSRCL